MSSPKMAGSMAGSAAGWAASVLAGLVLSAASVSAVAGPGSRPLVIELYTSQGCSSCPPADQLLEVLARRSDVLALGFHVDYWDGPDWRDKFSMKDATHRQDEAARALRYSPVGTPEMVVDGRAIISGVNPEALERALKLDRPDRQVQIDRQGNELTVRAGAPVPSERFDVYLIGYLPRAVTLVRGGENAKQTLTDVNIVRYIHKIGKSDAGNEWRLNLDKLPSDAQCIAVLFQVTPGGAIVGANSTCASRS